MVNFVSTEHSQLLVQMIIYNVSIPENKQSFFQEFLEMIGAEYEKENGNFKLSQTQKTILNERLREDKKSFIPAREALQQSRKKYEL